MSRLILATQRRLRELGRIRSGDQQPDKGGTLRAHPLEHWRLTSPQADLLGAAAVIYGGEVSPWPDAPGGAQHQLYTATDTLDVAIPPGTDPYSQAWEMWGAGGRVRSCDGETCEAVARETGEVVERPCLCDPEAPNCQPTTRVKLMLPRVPGLGVWLLVTHGMYAALELPGALDALGYLSDTGRPVLGRLRLEQRVKKVQGEKFPRRYAVPVLDLDVTVGELMSGEGGRRAPSLPAGGEHQLAAGNGAAAAQEEEGAPAPSAPPSPPLDTDDDLAPPLTDGQRHHLFGAALELGVERETLRQIARMKLGCGISEMRADRLHTLERAAKAYARGGEKAAAKLSEWVAAEEARASDGAQPTPVPAWRGDPEDAENDAVAPDAQQSLDGLAS